MAAIAQGNFVTAIRDDSISQVQTWLQKGMAVDQVDSMGFTPLGQAIITGKDRIVLYLILHGADEQQMIFGRTPLMVAVEIGHEAVVRALLDLEQIAFDKDVQFRMTRIDPDLKPDTDFSTMRFEVGIDAADKNGVTPYMKAAALGQSEIFRMFAVQSLCRGFDVMGRSWICHAIENRQETFLVEAFGQVNTAIPGLPPNHDSGSRITPELLSHADSTGRLPLTLVRELGLTTVTEPIETYCRLTIEKCVRDIAEISQYADAAALNRTTREMCLKALGQELPPESR